MQTLNRRLNPKILVGRQQHINQAVVLSECQRMLRNEHLKLRLRKDVKCGGCGVLSQRDHAVDEQEVVFELKVKQVTVRDARENDLAICGVARTAPQQLAAIAEEEWRIAEIRELFP